MEGVRGMFCDVFTGADVETDERATACGDAFDGLLAFGTNPRTEDRRRRTVGSMVNNRKNTFICPQYNFCHYHVYFATPHGGDDNTDDVRAVAYSVSAMP